jgi:hypothetical protein
MPWTGAVGAAAGAPGAAWQPGFGLGHPGIGTPGQGSLQAYSPARRKPAPAEVPSQVKNALILMWIGLGATVLSVIDSIYAVNHLDKIGRGQYAVDQAVLHAEGIVGLFALFAGIGGIIMWPVLAVVIRRGRKWGAVVAAVMFGLQAVCMIFLLAGATGAPQVKILSLIITGIGLAAVVMLWSGQARAFFERFK